MQIPEVIRPIRFAPEVETAYFEELHDRVMPLARILLLAASASFAAVAFWDEHVAPGVLSWTGPIRAVVCAVFIALFALSFLPVLRRRLIVISVAAYISAVGGFALILTQIPDGFLIGVAGLAVGAIFIPILSLRLWHGVVLALIAVAVPNLVMALAGESRFVVVHVNTMQTIAIIFALALAYLMTVMNRRIFSLGRSLAAEKERSERLLLNILPADVAELLKTRDTAPPAQFDEATVLFADIVGFTEFARGADADRVVTLLNDLFSRFDDLVESHDVEKVKTIGDAYMAVAGVPRRRDDHAEAMAALALDMRRALADFNREHGLGFRLRIGLHSGPLVAGVIGKSKFAYDMWGDTVNTASRMESEGLPDEIQLSDDTRQRLSGRYRAEPRGRVPLKGLGAMDAYLLKGPE